MWCVADAGLMFCFCYYVCCSLFCLSVYLWFCVLFAAVAFVFFSCLCVGVVVALFVGVNVLLLRLECLFVFVACLRCCVGCNVFSCVCVCCSLFFEGEGEGLRGVL